MEIFGDIKMKKFLSLLCACVLLACICACSHKKPQGEGINQRNVARFSPVLTDGENSFIKYEGPKKDEYVRLDDETFTLVKDDMQNVKLSVKKTDAEAAISIKAIEGRESEVKTSNSYKKAAEKLQKKLKNFDNYECIVIKIGDTLYGAVNCYRRASGEDGDELLYENFKESYLVTIKNDKVKLSKKISDMAILAVNSSHYIGYSELMFYSCDRESGERREIFKDRWYNEALGGLNYANAIFTDEVFLINGVSYEGNRALETTIVCKIDGSSVNLLVNNVRI